MSDNIPKCYVKYLAEKRGRECWRGSSCNFNYSYQRKSFRELEN